MISLCISTGSILGCRYGNDITMAYLRCIDGGNGVDQHSGNPDTVQYCSEGIKGLRNTDSAEKESCIFQ